MKKASKYSPSTEDDLKNESKCKLWLERCQAIKRKATHKMKLAQAEQKEWVKRAIERLQKEGGKGSKSFYTRIRHAIWRMQQKCEDWYQERT